MVHRKLNIIALILLVVFLTGCVTSQYANKSFKSQEIDRIVVLPFMDNRKNPDPKDDFAKMVNEGNTTMIHSLTYYKKYRTVLSGDIGNVSSYSVKDLPRRDRESIYKSSIDPESVDPEWIKQLGPSTEGWVLVPVLENLSTTNILIVSGTAEISVYLFNKHTGELWWQSSSKYKFTDFTGAFNIETPLYYAARECIKALPKRTGPYLLTDK